MSPVQLLHKGMGYALTVLSIPVSQMLAWNLQEMEHGFKELVDRILNGELGFEMTKNADR